MSAPKAMHVVVVGGGLAGLAASRELLARPEVLRVTLLEARHRLGGRVRSVEIANRTGAVCVADLGASWLHGTSGNDAFELAKAGSLLDDAVEGDESDGAEESEESSDSVVVDLAAGSLGGAEKQQASDVRLRVLGVAEAEDGGASVADRLIASVGELSSAALRRGGRVDGVAQRAAAQAASMACSIDGCHSLGLVGSQGSYKELDGPDLRVPGGMGGVVDVLAREVRAAGCDVRLGMEVSRIAWRGNGVVVAVRGGGEVVGDAAVCTLPLGVLKERALAAATVPGCVDGLEGVPRRQDEREGANAAAGGGRAAAASGTLFSPPLPEAQQRAIARAGAGVTNKLSLVFGGEEAGPPLPNVCTFLHPGAHAWSAPLAAVEDLRGAPALSQVAVDAAAAAGGGECAEARYWDAVRAHPWLAGVFGVMRASPLVADCFVAGECAVSMEREGEEEAGDALVGFLRLFLPELPTPERVLRSTWFSDPHSRGSYSYRSVLEEEGDAALLCRPLRDHGGAVKVAFAGEACSEHFYSTMHGAIQSGVEAARLVADAASGCP